MSTSDKICTDSCKYSDDVFDVNDMLQNMTTADTDNNVSMCGNCGKGEDESHKLKHCNACMMVKYCNRDCQIAHRPKHKKECRKRAAELHDEKLFKQPPPQYGDCPICCIRVPSLDKGWRYMACCGKVICSGCIYAPRYNDKGNKVNNETCPFCRNPYPIRDMETNERLKKRVEAGDAQAIYSVGGYHRVGAYCFPQDMDKALELWHRAAELGFAKSYNNIGHAYNNGIGVEVDKKKAMHYFELAAMGGNEGARHNLGINEGKARNLERALKHLMIAVRDGQPESLEVIKGLYSKGCVSKQDYTKALQAYQTYLGEITSEQRDEAAAFDSKKYRYY